MIATWDLSDPSGEAALEARLARLRLDARDLALARGELAEMEQSVRRTIADVAERGDAAVVELARRFDDPDFDAAHLRVTSEEMASAAGRVSPELRSALRHAIAQVRQYQSHILPANPPALRREGVELGLRFTPVDSAGLYFPGGKAAYPSSLIHLAVPALVAGVRRVVVCTPPSKYGRSDVVLAACHELGLEHVYRAGGAAAIAAMAFGTGTIPAVDLILGPGNDYVQLAKRAVSGGVGIDGYLGPSEVLVIADESGDAAFIASDLLAQAEHDPGSCFLLTTSPQLAVRVRAELDRQRTTLSRGEAIARSLADDSAIIVHPNMDRLIALANRIAAEHVNLQTRDNAAILSRLVHAGAVFVGPWSAVAAGDYVAGPSHCLPTNTTARFTSGVSVYSFLKRSGVVRYDPPGIAGDAPSVTLLAEEERLDAHAASVRLRTSRMGSD